MKIKYKTLGGLLILLLNMFSLKAQHIHDQDTLKDKPAEDSLAHSMSMDMPPMSYAFSLNLPMSRNGSGTSWLPDASPMYGTMIHTAKWMYMLHGDIKARYTNHDIFEKGSRGSDKFDAPNWFMAMAQRQVGKNGLFHWNAMLSLDPVTEGGVGYPLLFQSGESYKKAPIVDRQHPHDLFAELSLSYSHALSQKADVFAYLGYPGEPAIGPVAFMHRPSSLSNSDAPLGHHWTDATHITFGVATLGFRYNKFKIEASSFTGLEPDEHRFNFDKPKFDSWSGRLSFNPSGNWALQISQAFIKSPELLHGDENVNRTTASAIYSKPFGSENWINLTGLWGMNKTKEHSGENAALLEGDLRLKKLSLYTRYEWVQKSTEELDLPESTFGHNAVFPVNALTLGFNYDLTNLGPLRLAAGAQVTGYEADKRLDVLYGKNPIAGEVFIRLYPKLMKM